MKFEHFIIAMIIGMIVFAGYSMMRLSEINHLCRDKGGMLVDTPAGKACIKAERIQL